MQASSAIHPANTFAALSCFLLLIPLAHGPAQAQEERCQAKLYRQTGDYLRCLMHAEAALARGQKPGKNEAARRACERAYEKGYLAALKLASEGCPATGGVASGAPSPLAQEIRQTVAEVRGMVSGTLPNPVAGQLMLYNHCVTPIKIMSPTSHAIDGSTLPPYGSLVYPTGSGGGLSQNAANTFMFVPITSDAQCALVNCGNWADIQAAGQRMGYMWMNNAPNQPPGNNNLTYAAYCQPTNAAVGQCTTTATTPCCGSQMNFDRTFGTTFEITPKGGAGLDQDFVDLSTNYGASPTSPPTLCSANGADPDNCVSETANIFFNVPIRVDMSNSAGCTFPQGGSSLGCTDVACPDAYQYPVDNKQVACPAGTGYVVTLCPGTHQLPSLGQASAIQDKVTIQNNLDKNSPCPNGNTVSMFTAGGQQVIPPGGGSLTLQGNYSVYPGIGLQINNWYWTSENLPVQAGPPQNPDNSGAQFVVSDACTVSQSPPVYGKGIETYKVSTVTARKTGANDCLITISEKPPYTDAVTPGCCAPPLRNMANVCTGPWGVTNNQQPWPPQ